MALKELEARFAKPRQKPFKMGDGEGLHLLIQPNGSKLWQMKYRFGGKEKLLSFGKYPGVTLSAARAKRMDAKLKLADGIDPGAKPNKDPTDLKSACRSFETVARAWHKNRESSLDPAHAQRVLARLERDVFPALGNRRMEEIKAPDVLDVVRAVEARGALDVSRRLKQCIGQVFRFAIASGWAENDPTVHLLGALKPRPRAKHMARIPLTELKDLVRAIAAYDGEETARRREITRQALTFTFLTWARTGEVRFATWGEFEGLDGPEPLWRIPAERMKMEREHLVPLARQVVDMLRALTRSSNSHYVFPGPKGEQPISGNTMIYACYRMGYRGRQTVHGFRGLASTWANEAERYNPDWIELALAHVDENQVRGAYNSALYLTPRRRMLQDWANHLARCLEDEAPSRSQSLRRIGSRSCEPVVRAGFPMRPGAAELLREDKPLRLPYWQRE